MRGEITSLPSLYCSSQPPFLFFKYPSLTSKSFLHYVDVDGGGALSGVALRTTLVQCGGAVSVRVLWVLVFFWFCSDFLSTIRHLLLFLWGFVVDLSSRGICFTGSV
jgi:hypothetical protein